MLARECFGYEKEGKRGESTHRPNEKKMSRRERERAWLRIDGLKS
jgi:hypothetical protein